MLIFSPWVANVHGRRALRSASSSRLVELMFRLSTVGSRTFNVSRTSDLEWTARRRWSAPTFSSFRRRLKPFVFQQSYPDVVIQLYIWHYSGPCSDVYHLGHSKNHRTEANAVYYLRAISLQPSNSVIVYRLSICLCAQNPIWGCLRAMPHSP